MIRKIAIQNIRGFENVELDVNIKPNFANICVAPNGFGKSSLSTAFRFAQGKKLSVPESEKFQHEGQRPASLKILVDETWLEANESKNEISDWGKVFSIKSSIEPKAKLPKINGITIAKPYMQIPDLDLGPAPENEKLKYQHATAKSQLSPNEKVFPNLQVICSPGHVREALLAAFNDIDKLRQTKPSRFLESVLNFIRVCLESHAQRASLRSSRIVEAA